MGNAAYYDAEYYGQIAETRWGRYISSAEQQAILAAHERAGKPSFLLDVGAAGDRSARMSTPVPSPCSRPVYPTLPASWSMRRAGCFRPRMAASAWCFAWASARWCQPSGSWRRRHGCCAPAACWSASSTTGARCAAWSSTCCTARASPAGSITTTLLRCVEGAGASKGLRVSAGGGDLLDAFLDVERFPPGRTLRGSGAAPWPRQAAGPESQGRFRSRKGRGARIGRLARSRLTRRRGG